MLGKGIGYPLLPLATPIFGSRGSTKKYRGDSVFSVFMVSATPATPILSIILYKYM